MGCCIQSREDPNIKDKSNMIVNPKGKISNKFISKYAFSSENNKSENKIENVKNFFKTNNPNQNSANSSSNVNNNANSNTKELNNSGNIDSSQNNTITLQNNNGQSLFKMIRKSSQNVVSSLNHNSDREKKEKENNETLEKIKSSRENNDEEKIVKLPRVEFHITNSKNTEEKSICLITPNSINNQIKKLGEKFYFGKEDARANKPNHYNFNDDSIGVRQFEIAFNTEKGKFFLVDNKRGTGLFIKIKQRICVDHDMIVSFCASHMILQLDAEGSEKKSNSIKIRFLQGPHQNQDWIFSPSEKKTIRIGRSKSAEIVYKDDSVSRIQCTLHFENNNWFLYDGHLDNGNKGSTNGLWLLASSKVEVVNDMILKTGNTTIKVVLVEN